MPWIAPVIGLVSTAASAAAAAARQRAAQRAAQNASSQAMASGKMEALQNQGDELQLGKSLGDAPADTGMGGFSLSKTLDLMNPQGGAAGGGAANAALGLISPIASTVIGGVTAPDTMAAAPDAGALSPDIAAAASGTPITPDVAAGLDQVNKIAEAPITPAGPEEYKMDDMTKAYDDPGTGKFGPSYTGVESLGKDTVSADIDPSTWGSNDQSKLSTSTGNSPDSWGRFGKMMAEKAAGAGINTLTAAGAQALLRRKKPKQPGTPFTGFYGR